MAAIQPKTPAPLERIVLTALAKDPNKRWQDAGDLARELAWVAADSHTTRSRRRRARARRQLPAWAMPAAAAVHRRRARRGRHHVDRTRDPAIRNPIRNRNPPSRSESAIRNPQSAIRNFVVLPCRAERRRRRRRPIATG